MDDDADFIVGGISLLVFEGAFLWRTFSRLHWDKTAGVLGWTPALAGVLLAQYADRIETGCFSFHGIAGYFATFFLICLVFLLPAMYAGLFAAAMICGLIMAAKEVWGEDTNKNK